MSATPRTKYAEYRQKMLDWGRIFEEEYGSPPTEEDKTSSQTWTALNEKSVYYKKLCKEQGKELPSTPASSPEKSSRRSRREPRDTSTGGHRSGKSRSSRRDHSDSPEASRHSRREGSKRHSRRQVPAPDEAEGEAGAPAVEEPPPPPPGPPPLPEIDPSLAEHPDVASLEAKAREAREKLLKWERAYEREQGEPPRAEDRAASNTYTS